MNIGVVHGLWMRGQPLPDSSGVAIPCGSNYICRNHHTNAACCGRLWRGALLLSSAQALTHPAVISARLQLADNSLRKPAFFGNQGNQAAANSIGSKKLT